MWLQSTLSSEGHTRGWMPDEDFRTYTVFFCSHSSRSITAHNIFWSMAEDFFTEYLLCIHRISLPLDFLGFFWNVCKPL
jgi:hypothetical protein